MKQCIEQIRDTLLPSNIISRKVSLKQKGAGEFTGLCPFHSEKTPSFTVSDEKGFYHCFGCGAHGDVIGFISQTEGMSFKDAVEKLAHECGIQLPKYSPKQVEQEQKENSFFEVFELATVYYEQQLNTPEGKKALEYLKRRGLKPEIIKQFRLGYAPLNHSEMRTKHLTKFSDDMIAESTVLVKGQSGGVYNLFRGRVIFPIMNRKNKVIAFGGRILGEGEPKYLNSPENPIFKKGDELELHSDNKNYEPYTVHISDVLEVWQFVCTLNVSDKKEEELNLESIMNMLKSMRVEMESIKQKIKVN